MASHALPALQQLDRLDSSLSDFQDQLIAVLSGKEYRESVPNLQGSDLIWFVNHLDKVLDCIDPSSVAYRKCLHELRSICGDKAILPSSYRFSSDLNVDRDPFADGGYATAHKGTAGGSKVCVKRVRVYARDGPQRAIKAFCEEAIIWKRMTHPNLVPFLGATTTPLQFISDWMSGGDLPGYIKQHPNADRLGLLSDVTKGLCYIHSCNVVHGDLKGGNILVDNLGNARIADFGLASVTKNPDFVENTSYHDTYTAQWAAPEVLIEGTHSKEGDMFAFAMVMIEVFTGKAPFAGCKPAWAMLEIMEGRRPPRPVHPRFTGDLWLLMQRCWDPDPNLRLEASEALKALMDAGSLPGPSSVGEKVISRQTSGRDPSGVKTSNSTSRHDLQTGSESHHESHANSDGNDWEFLQGREDEDTSEHTFDFKALINHSLTTDERISLITTIFSECIRPRVGGSLSKVDYQTIVDIIYEALDSLAPRIRRRCLRFLPNICGHQALLPKSLSTSYSYDLTGTLPHDSGGSADVWKGRYHDKVVALKVLRVHRGFELVKTRHVFCREAIIWKTLHHPNVLSLLSAEMAGTRFVMVSEWMRNGNINQFLKHVDADRLRLLADMTRGLAYMHDRELVHGDVKGINVLIDNDGHARLADFGLISLIPDKGDPSSRVNMGGTTRWMSPERLDPDKFCLQDSGPTKESDCYALGLTIYEVLSGHMPFFQFNNVVAIWKVMNGERPERPQGVWFTDGVWELLECCWRHEPGERVNAESVLLCLERTPPPLRPDANEQQDATPASDSYPLVARGVVIPNPDLPIACVDNGPQVPSPSSLPDKMNSTIPQGDGELLNQPQMSHSWTERSIEWLARRLRRVFGANPKKLGGLRKAGRSKSDQT